MDRDYILVTAGIIVDPEDGRVLIAQRPAGGRHPGSWEFPGGKVEPGETLQECLARELAEEVGIEARVGVEMARVRYSYPDLAIELIAFSAEIVSGTLSDLHCRNHRWVTRSELPGYDLLPPDRVLEREIFEK